MHNYKRNNTKWVGTAGELAFKLAAHLKNITVLTGEGDMGRYDCMVHYRGINNRVQIKVATFKESKKGGYYIANTDSVIKGKSVIYSSNSIDFLTVVILPDERFQIPVIYNIPIEWLGTRKGITLAPHRDNFNGNATTVIAVEQFKNNWDIFKAILLKDAA